MDPSPIKPGDGNAEAVPSQQSEGSQTAADFIRDQMQLELDAREALPYVCATLSLCLSLCSALSLALFPPPVLPLLCRRLLHASSPISPHITSP